MRGWPLAVLVTAATAEFLWRAFPCEIQSDIYNISQWLALATIGAAGCYAPRSRRLRGSILAAVVMAATGAACSGWWLLARFDTLPCQVYCADQVGFPLELVSVLIVLYLLARPDDDR